MKSVWRAAAVFLSLTCFVPDGVAAIHPQLARRPYDSDAVRQAAAEIQRQLKNSIQLEDALADPLQFIVESLADIGDLDRVPDEVLDALVALAGSERVAADALLRLGDRAVAPLVRSARTPFQAPFYQAGALDTLQEMLQRAEIERTLSPVSRTAVRALVRDLLSDRRLGFVELASLGCLAVATADPDLRGAAVRLTSPSELAVRGVPSDEQSFVVSKIKKALDATQKMKS